MKSEQIKKKFHNKVFKITDHIYGFDLILICGDYDYYQKYLKKNFQIEEQVQVNEGGEAFIMSKSGNLHTSNKGGTNSVVWIPFVDFTSSNYSVICHELLHISLRVMQCVGVKFDYENQEPITYYFEYLVRESLGKLTKHYYGKS